MSKADTIKATIKSLRDTFKTGVTHPESWRENQLKQLIKMMESESDKLKEGLKSDLGKCNFEFYMTEWMMAVAEAKETLKHLHSWMKPQAVSTPMLNVKGLSSSSIQPTPLGVVLIIAPWNYPINLVICPLVGAIAAGNCVLIKPSELAPATSRVFAEIIPKYLDNNAIKVLEGGVEETTEILKHKFDHILYTGSTAIGKVIMRAAAEFLTPVTLELGGKNPTFVDSNVDLNTAARRIAWAKWTNCGQTCLTVDYVLAQKDIADQLADKVQKELETFYGQDPKQSSDYGKIISKRHVQRLKSYFDDLDAKKIAVGGPSRADEEGRYFPPTILRNLPETTKIMQEEIFGPILVINSVDSVDEAIDYVSNRPHPLGLYIFTNDSRYKKKVIEGTQSGSVVVNDAMMQFPQFNLPFGGVGESGMGAYHGKKSFETFSHMRPVLDKTMWFDLSFRYPPYNEGKLSQAKYFV
eukprot:TRINITY_DN289_c0_g1_i1.p1 TRINITY_DN289_c0_g1~~TRINITY_DN289_c0_g1_i1.p1  ORF type:complete len:467 (-),score=152.64 TRINITY_DN289_c0_g1_i1:46-1446(-)